MLTRGQALTAGTVSLILFIVLINLISFRVEESTTRPSQSVVVVRTVDVVTDKTVRPSTAPTARPSFSPTSMNPDLEMSTYVWVFGIAQQCDIGLDSTVRLHRGFWTRGKQLRNIYSNISRGDIVWVWAPEAHNFVEQILPSTKNPFVLVVSGEDNTFPWNVINTGQLYRLIGNPYVIHVFAQNFDNRNLPPRVLRKVTHIPIGYDFQIPGYRGFSRSNPNVTEQVAILDGIIAHMPARSERRLRIFEDFHHSNWMRDGWVKQYLEFGGQDRSTIFQAINATGLVDYSSVVQSRYETYMKKIQYIFTVSPPGNGIDCHRTWEDLLLGCIVIVMEAGMDPMYEGLPVVVVRNWTEEVNYENLVLWEKRFRNVTYESYRHKLMNKYWLDKMIAKAAPFKE
jgi:hypothetical protein